MIRFGVRPGRNDTILQPSSHKVGVESWTVNALRICGLYFLAKAGVSIAKVVVFPWPCKCLFCQISFSF
jgi:hypothetical protein